MSTAVSALPCTRRKPFASVTRMKSSRSGSTSALVRRYAVRWCSPAVSVKRGAPFLKTSAPPTIARLSFFSSATMSTRCVNSSVATICFTVGSVGSV